MSIPPRPSPRVPRVGVLLGALGFLLAGPGVAQELALGVKASTTGLGAELTLGLSRQANLRVGGSGYRFDRTFTEQQITYEGTAKLAGGSVLLDLHPGGGLFRLSVGAVASRNVVTAHSVGGTVVVNGTSYDVRDVGVLSGEVKGNTLCPYVGIGLGNAVGKGAPVKLVLDIGAYYMGSPKVSLTAAPAAPAQVPPGFAENLEQERRKIEDRASKYRYFPVVSIGISVKI